MQRLLNRDSQRFIVLSPFAYTRSFLYKQSLYKQTSTPHDKNLSNSSTGQRNAKQFENSSSDPNVNENRKAAIKKQVIVDISTPAHFCMQDTIDICCATTFEIVL